MQLYLGIAAILFRTQVLIDLGDLYFQFMGTQGTVLEEASTQCF